MDMEVNFNKIYKNIILLQKRYFNYFSPLRKCFNLYHVTRHVTTWPKQRTRVSNLSRLHGIYVNNTYPSKEWEPKDIMNLNFAMDLLPTARGMIELNYVHQTPLDDVLTVKKIIQLKFCSIDGCILLLCIS